MLNAFPFAAFNFFTQKMLVAHASDLPGFDVGVHESGEYQEISIKDGGGNILKAKLEHTGMKGSEVTHWQFSHIMNPALKIVIFND